LLWKAWLSDERTKASMACPLGHPDSQQLATSRVLDRFDELVDAGDPRRLRWLWAALAARWGGEYEPANASVRCVHSQHGVARARGAMSLLQYALVVPEWVPARRGRATVLVAPAQAWRLASGTP